MKTIAIILSAAMIAGCAGPQGANYRPIVDRPGPNYATDLQDCQDHARKLASVGEGAAGGAMAGAIFGALLGAAFRVGSRDTAWAGALGGATGGAAKAETDQRSVIANCMRARGYAVLQ